MNNEVAILCTGSELMGRKQDTNSFWIASKLQSIGYASGEIRIVRDDFNKILSTIKEWIEMYPIIFVTGGMGNTGDDFSRKVIFELGKGDLKILGKEYRKHLYTLYKKWIGRLPRRAMEQLVVTSDSIPLFNKKGTSPGILLRCKTSTIFFLPGVPDEVKCIFNGHIKKHLLNNQKKQVKKYSAYFEKLSETELNHYIKRKNWIQYEGIDIGIYCSKNIIELQVTDYENRDIFFYEWQELLKYLKMNLLSEDVTNEFIAKLD
ncbi:MULTISPECIES: molybdopterin-binding protein [Bacillus cereus group]|uniref:Molybdopterin binding domain containing protein n=1 Tax=Bacillus thuringiensis TaxID=1428 RepID=A0A1C4E3W9_BACTU|nr:MULTISPECIES: molybdopterin-binding protein [Bacillus cereus group]MED3025669.1 molybdopterin-binding protein [Bacillus wiedmannii]OTX98533.1 hypothetical protein BK729_13280 [Bacillus thuringiensis serovar wratislaviensis]OUB59135.1 hypothetical protein BK743_13175 [Bacillus thuringiensis serovar sylvestriensis]SCC38205.1 Molybdopterin binding domain containing protein [Bacillus thuringiensis]